ncbi:MAG: MerR family transcriptional regulator [Burkholderiaceae bacterium]|nr:MerR family transcriptional regulator [Burkholderiaceae bacterium]
MEYGPFDRLLRPHLTEAPTEPQYLSRKELLAAADITERKLTYYIQQGAVARPIGKTRAAKYTASHLTQIQRTVELLKNHQTTVAEIGQAYASKTPGTRAALRTPKQHPQAGVRQVVYWLADGVSIVANENLLEMEKKLLKRVLKAGKLSTQESAQLTSQTLERGDRLLNQVNPRRPWASRKKCS